MSISSSSSSGAMLLATLMGAVATDGLGMFAMSGWVFFICTGAAGLAGGSGINEIRAVSFLGPEVEGAIGGMGAGIEEAGR